MVDISVSLVRKAHGNLDADSLMKLDIISLNNYNIEEIDNLEVFDQIRELHLSGNRIKVIENLEFLYHLEYLDISNNCIDGPGLRKAIGRLPSSLQTIVLGGNSCCDDEELLCELNDAMPTLGIVIGLEQQQQLQLQEEEEASRKEEASQKEQSSLLMKSERQYQGVNPHLHAQTKSSFGPNGSLLKKRDENMPPALHNNNEKEDDEDDEEEEEDEDSAGDVNDGNDSDGAPKAILDADKILKEIVERKCSLQNMPTAFNINDTIQALNSECEIVMKDVSQRASTSQLKREDVLKEMSRNQHKRTELNEVDLNALLQRTKQRAADSKDFLADFRERMMKTRESTFEKVLKKDI